MRKVGWWFVVLVMLSAGVLVQAQEPLPAGAARVTLGNATVPLYGPWKFHVGDSPIDPKTGEPLWAEPGFDDSGWQTMSLESKPGVVDPGSGMTGYVPGWTAQGHPGYWGYAWYRIRVSVDVPPGQALALAGPTDFDDAYQVFANGKLVGGFGDFTGAHPEAYYSQPTMFRLRGPGRSRVLAFRFWMTPATLQMAPEAGGMHDPPVLGEADVVGLSYQSKWLTLIRLYAGNAVLLVVFCLLATLAFSLILFDPSDGAYLWMGLLFLTIAAYDGITQLTTLSQLLNITTSNVLDGIVLPLNDAAWVMVWWIWFGRGVFRRLPQLVAVLAGLEMVCWMLGYEVFYGLIPHSVGVVFYNAAVGFSLILVGLLAWIVGVSIRRYGIEGWLVLPVVILRVIGLLVDFYPTMFPNRQWFPFGVQLSLGMISDFLVGLVIAVLLLRRLLQSLKRQREMALDVKQAQEVQRVILPEHGVAMLGYQVESEYRPAREVGGDFFQVIPNEKDGSLLIVAGDVTGKGLQAGMLVALLVGSIRQAAEAEIGPAGMLGALNRRLLGRGDARATCLAMRIERDGAATLANAGHLPPYLNGTPVEIDGSLPLGILEEYEFPVLRFEIAERDRLLLISDGVLEARDANGELFGFERVEELMRTEPSAASVADTAQDFGQDDDISVIAVMRLAI
jgi:hypothetical protein